MTHRTARRAGLALAALAISFGATACANNDGDPDTFSGDTVPADGVTSQFEATLTDAGFTDFTDADCGELKDEKGETGECTVTIGGEEFTVESSVAETNATTTTLDYDISALPAPTTP